jgi:hypothetical protein
VSREPLVWLEAGGWWLEALLNPCGLCMLGVCSAHPDVMRQALQRTLTREARRDRVTAEVLRSWARLLDRAGAYEAKGHRPSAMALRDEVRRMIGDMVMILEEKERPAARQDVKP